MKRRIENATSIKINLHVTIFLELSLLSEGQGLEFDTKYHILHAFRTSASLEERSSHHLKDLHKLKLLTNFDVNPKSSPGGVMNDT